jgi:hypothetical protein
MTDGEAREMARELVRGSIIEDAASQFIAQILKHAHDERIKPLRDRIEALTKERNALRSALNRIRPIPERILRGIPVRDLAETLAEADSALIKGESHE